MAITWTLKKWLAINRDIYRASELQLLLAEKAGVRLSLQAISAIINAQPSALRLQTIQALCNALDCKLSDFCDVVPDSPAQRKQKAASSPVALYGGSALRPVHSRIRGPFVRRTSPQTAMTPGRRRPAHKTRCERCRRLTYSVLKSEHLFALPPRSDRFHVGDAASPFIRHVQLPRCVSIAHAWQLASRCPHPSDLSSLQAAQTTVFGG
jgi:putative transcriptional regulator